MELNNASTCMCLQNYPKLRFLTVVVVIPKQLDVPICGRSPNPEHISDVFNTDPERPFESKSSLKSTEAPIFAHEKNHISCHWNHLGLATEITVASGFLSGIFVVCWANVHPCSPNKHLLFVVIQFSGARQRFFAQNGWLCLEHVNTWYMPCIR